MSRGGRRKAHATPERRCLATGITGAKQGMIRFVVGPDGAVFADVRGQLPGRGMWVQADRAALEKAVSKRLFSRSAKMQVAVGDDLIGQIDSLLAKRIIELVSLARKAGEAVTGFEKVKASLVGGDAALLLQAKDGSVREMARLRPPLGENCHITAFTAHELGLAFGREHVIHAALFHGGLAEQVRIDSARLLGVRG